MATFSPVSATVDFLNKNNKKEIPRKIVNLPNKPLQTCHFQ